MVFEGQKLIFGSALFCIMRVRQTLELNNHIEKRMLYIFDSSILF